MSSRTDRTAPPAGPATPDDTPTLPIRVRQRPGRHRAKPDTPTRHRAHAATPSSIATWAGGRHYRPEVTR